MYKILILLFVGLITIGIGVKNADAYVILSSDSCGLFDCCSIVNIVNHTTPELNQLKNTAREDLRTHIGKIDFTTIQILNSSSIKICGNINGATNNFWGIGTFWNSTWWNSSYGFRYPFYLTSSAGAFLFSVNDSSRVMNQDIYWTNISNSTKNYVYCKSSGCINSDIRIAQETLELKYHNETNLTGNSSTGVYDDNYQMVLHMNNVSATDSTKYKQIPTQIGGLATSQDVIFGTGLNFTGNDGIQYSGASCFNHTGAFTGWTVEMWVSTASLSAVTDEKYFWRGDSEEIRAKIGENLDAGNQLFCSSFNGSWASLKYTIAKNVTYYVVCRWNGTALGLFVNGVQVASAHVPTFTASNSGCAIGSQMGGQEFRGFMDEFRVSNISRSDQYIADQYKNGIGTLTYFGAEELPDDIVAPYWNETQTDYRNITNCTLNYAESYVNVSWYDPEDRFNWCYLRHNATGSFMNYTNLGDAYYPPYVDYTFNISANCSETIGVSWIMYCNDTSGNWNNTGYQNFTVTNLCTCPVATTGAYNKYCINSSFLQTQNYYNEYSDKYVNITEYCTYGCDTTFNLCKPNGFMTVVYIFGGVVVLLFILKWIKRNWL